MRRRKHFIISRRGDKSFVVANLHELFIPGKRAPQRTIGELKDFIYDEKGKKRTNEEMDKIMMEKRSLVLEEEKNKRKN